MKWSAKRLKCSHKELFVRIPLTEHELYPSCVSDYDSTNFEELQAYGAALSSGQ